MEEPPTSQPSAQDRIRELENKIRAVGTLREADIRRLEKELNLCKNQAAAVRKEIDEINGHIERSEMLSWNIIFRNVPARPIAVEQVIRKTKPTPLTSAFSEEVRNSMKTTTFNIWKHDESEMMQLIELMFYELEVMDAFNIPEQNLQHLISTVRDNYKKNPFHNFVHGFCVTQMVYALLWTSEIAKKLPKLNLLIVLVSAICHDLDHPGFNNAFQINAQTELAIRYNDASPLENHHAAMAFKILNMPDCNIFVNIPPDVYRNVRSGVIGCILATDMGRHGEIFSKFKERVAGNFNIEADDDRNLLMQMLIKTADVSNEARPMLVSEPWVDFLLDEFFNQSDTEKELGLPVAPFMDREKVTKPQAQIGFIQFVLIPMFEAMAKLFPPLTDALVAPAKEAHGYYVKLKEKEDAEKKLQKEKEKQAAAQAAQNPTPTPAPAQPASEQSKPVVPVEPPKVAPAAEQHASSPIREDASPNGSSRVARPGSGSNKVGPLRKNQSADNQVGFGSGGTPSTPQSKETHTQSTASFPISPAQVKRRSMMRQQEAAPPKQEAKSKVCTLM